MEEEARRVPAPGANVAGPCRRSAYCDARDGVESSRAQRRARQGGGGLRQGTRDEPMCHAARDSRGAHLSTLRGRVVEAAIKQQQQTNNSKAAAAAAAVVKQYNNSKAAALQQSSNNNNLIVIK